MSDKIVRHYDESKNPDGAFLAGIPLRDLTEDEFDALTKRDQRRVDDSPLYLKSKPRSRTDDAPQTVEKES